MGHIKQNKRWGGRILLGLELAVFLYIYIFGSQGVWAYCQVKKENGVLEGQIAQLRNEIVQINQQVVDWQQDVFGKEKIAREQLQMARKDDDVYYLD